MARPGTRSRCPSSLVLRASALPVVSTRSWRYFPARSAARLMAANDERRTEEVAARLRTALANDGIFIIQVIFAVVVAVAVAVGMHA
jgi:hypothetical protein